MLPKITIPPHLLHLMICNAKHWRRPDALLKRTTWTYSKNLSNPPVFEEICAILMRIQRYFKTQEKFIYYQIHSFLKIILFCA